MGDPDGGPLPTGLDPKQVAAYTEFFAKSGSVDSSRWQKAEQCTEELIKRIRGTRSSEERRKDIANYVTYLIKNCFECQVFILAFSLINSSCPLTKIIYNFP
jgi:hypothetical protein